MLLHHLHRAKTSAQRFGHQLANKLHNLLKRSELSNVDNGIPATVEEITR